MNINDEYVTSILRRNNEGEGVAKINNLTIFVSGALTNEKVKIKIDKVEKNYAHGFVIEVIDKSVYRRNPICPYYYECGGCNIMHESYNSQLNFKKEKIKSIFKKISSIDIDLDVEYDKEFNYRNKVVLKIKNDKIGYYKNKTNEIVEIDKCAIADENINEILLKLKQFIKENSNNNISEVMKI